MPTLFVIYGNNAAYQNSNVSKYSSQVLVLETRNLSLVLDAYPTDYLSNQQHALQPY